VAKSMIHMSGRHEVEIVYTGLRAGEKLSEELFSPGEAVARSSHHLITQVRVPALDGESLPEGLSSQRSIREWMRDGCDQTPTSVAS